MSNIVHSLENAVEAGLKGIVSIAEGYMSPPASAPIPIAHASTLSPHSSAASSLASRLALAKQDTLLQLADVQSGWIHLQSTYLDSSGGQRRVRSFGLTNVAGIDVDVEVVSDLGSQVVFWIEDEKASSSSSSSASSLSSSAGTPSVNLVVPAGTTVTVFLAFLPNTSQPSTPAQLPSPSSDGGFTPRVLPIGASADLASIPVGTRLPPSSVMSEPGSASTSSQSVTNSSRTDAAMARRTDAVHRSFSVHGSIVIRATSQAWEGAEVLMPTPHQSITLPFFATVCRSFFSTAMIDPATGLASGNQLSQGQLLVDFGTDNVVGNEYHRDILIVNRSEIDLVWTTAVVNSRFKDSAWFTLRDIDSENLFGVDCSAQPVPLPALSSRHLRLALRVRAPVTDFDFDFVISNIHQSGNVVTCRAIGSCQASSYDDTLRIPSGSTLDFGQISDGSWAKKLLVTKNVGDRPIDVHFSATSGYEVVFVLAGVAGEDIDEDIPVRTAREKRTDQLSRTSTREGIRGRDASTFRIPPSDTTGSIGTTVSEFIRHGLDQEDSSAVASSDRESSMPPSRSLSRVTSRASSYKQSRESDEDEQSQFFSPASEVISHEISRTSETLGDRDVPNQIEELTMRPGTEYRVFAMYRPERDLINPPAVAGALRTSTFKLFLDSAPSSSRSAARSRKVVHCTAESCTSIIDISSGHLIDFGEVTVGASKTTTISIANLSALSARVEISAISKVLNTNRNIIVIPPFEVVDERLDFFPRRINDSYEKQVFVRNHHNRANNQLIEIRSKNVDVYNVTLHSHLYRILTPSGSNFLDFGSVVINSPSVRTIQFQNLTLKPLILDLAASQPEDIELYIKLGDVPMTPAKAAIMAKYAPFAEQADRPNGDLKERFMETLQELEQGVKEPKQQAKSKARDKSTTRANKEGENQTLGATVAAALKRGGRGKPVQLYGNAVVFKDRTLLEDHEYLDLASGPPVAPHRTSPGSKCIQLLETIELEDKSKLSGQHPRIPRLDFAASAKATGLLSKETKKRSKGAGQKAPATPTKSGIASGHLEAKPDLPAIATSLSTTILKESGNKSPALTGKRAELKLEPATVNDVTKLSPDELILAIEHHEAKRSASSATHLSPEEEEQYVRRLIALRKELQTSINAGKFVPARTLSVPPGGSRQLVVVMTPNGSTRPHVSSRAKRADSRIFIKLVEFDRTLLSQAIGSSTDLSDLPVRDLIIKSSCVRSVLEVQQSSINFGTCERGEVKSRTIVIHNKSDCAGVFRMRTSGSIASGNLKLGLGRYGIISAFGRKEVASFSFTPSMVGNFQETIVVENVLDSFNDQNVLVKATVRRMPTFSLDIDKIDFAPNPNGQWPAASSFVLTNISKTERLFVIETERMSSDHAFAEITLSRDEKDAGIALSKGEEEEVEGMLQKLKIARRKGKADKIAKYEKRLSELGVVTTTTESVLGKAANDDTIVESLSGAITPVVETASTPSIGVSLQANQKVKIIVQLLPRVGTEPLLSVIKVFDRKNTDEILAINVTALPRPVEVIPAPLSSLSQEPLNLAIMRHCLTLTLQCPVSPTAFCVGSTLFLPASSTSFALIRPFFPIFSDPSTGEVAGLLLADGFSRQIPGNTHAEANALTNFNARMKELEHSVSSLPPASDILKEAECFATMEPCSIRTSGGPSCALELVRAKVTTVYLGVEEPPDFVQCEGVRILEEGGVQVRRIVGLEEDCLRCARRGRS